MAADQADQDPVGLRQLAQLGQRDRMVERERGLPGREPGRLRQRRQPSAGIAATLRQQRPFDPLRHEIRVQPGRQVQRGLGLVEFAQRDQRAPVQRMHRCASLSGGRQRTAGRRGGAGSALAQGGQDRGQVGRIHARGGRLRAVGRGARPAGIMQSWPRQSRRRPAPARSRGCSRRRCASSPSIPNWPRPSRRAPAPGRPRRADRVGKLRQPARAGSPGHRC